MPRDFRSAWQIQASAMLRGSFDASECITAPILPTQIEWDDRPTQHDVVVVEFTPAGRAALSVKNKPPVTKAHRCRIQTVNRW